MDLGFVVVPAPVDGHDHRTPGQHSAWHALDQGLDQDS
jgi:hypothetical protein